MSRNQRISDSLGEMRDAELEIQERVRCSLMRGGTSKAVFLMRNDLPLDEARRDNLILRIYGSPDLRQIDGLGGADSLTSKLAIIGPSTRDDCHVDYLFGQVSLTEPVIDYRGNCGNISAAVGPFAIDEGLVDVQEPITSVRIHQVNTGTIIVAQVPVKDGKAEVEGLYGIDGVPGTGAKIELDFSASAGAVTGSLLPTGNITETITIDHLGDVEASLVDAGNPCIFIKASAVGLTGTETPQQIDNDAHLLANLEKIRCIAAERMGLAISRDSATVESPYVPFVIICAPPVTFSSWTEHAEILDHMMDLSAREVFMQRTHKAYAVTGTVCTLAAALIPGTIVHQVTRPGLAERGKIHIGHPQGIMTAEGVVREKSGVFTLERAVLGRTARCLMKGYAFVPTDTFRVP